MWCRNTNPYISVYVSGLRNSYGITVGRAGNVAINVNGPNDGNGPKMTGLDASKNPITGTGPEPFTLDAVWLDIAQVCLSQYKLSK